QEFIPLPMTRACVQYVTGVDPMTAAELHVPRGERERRMQKALVRWKAPESRKLVEEALAMAERPDLLERFHRARRAHARRGQAARGGRRLRAAWNLARQGRARWNRQGHPSPHADLRARSAEG